MFGPAVTHNVCLERELPYRNTIIPEYYRLLHHYTQEMLFQWPLRGSGTFQGCYQRLFFTCIGQNRQIRQIRQIRHMQVQPWKLEISPSKYRDIAICTEYEQSTSTRSAPQDCDWTVGSPHPGAAMDHVRLPLANCWTGVACAICVLYGVFGPSGDLGMPSGAWQWHIDRETEMG